MWIWWSHRCRRDWILLVAWPPSVKKIDTSEEAEACKSLQWSKVNVCSQEFQHSFQGEAHTISPVTRCMLGKQLTEARAGGLFGSLVWVPGFPLVSVFSLQTYRIVDHGARCENPGDQGRRAVEGKYGNRRGKINLDNRTLTKSVSTAKIISHHYKTPQWSSTEV